MVELTLILDGASEARGPRTSLERARTPNLDRLASAGTLMRLRTVPPGLPAGSETAIPALLGWRAPAPVDRGALEAAAIGLELERGWRAWRIDVIGADGRRPGAGAVGGAAEALRKRLPDHRVRRLRGHRLLVSGPPPLPAAARGTGLRPWPEGAVPPRLLDSTTAMVAAPSAAAGAARLLGARVLEPAGATGGTDTDLLAKAEAAREAAAAGARRVFVHVGGPDEAAHEHDRAAKLAILERVDRELVPPLAELARSSGATLRVCPDHGCDPRSGEHDAAPVPCLLWRAGESPAGPSPRYPSSVPDPQRRLTERAVAALPVIDPEPLAEAVAA